MRLVLWRRGFRNFVKIPPPSASMAVVKRRGGAPPPAQFDSRLGGRARSTGESGAEPRGRLFPAVLHRFLVRSTRPSPSRPAMDTRGGEYALPVSHPTTGTVADPNKPRVQNDGGKSPPPFWTARWVVSIAHRRYARRRTPGEPGAPPNAFRLPARREGTIDGKKRCKTAGNTLSRSFEALFGALGKSIAVPTGDGHPGRWVALPVSHPTKGDSRIHYHKGCKRERRLSSSVVRRRLCDFGRASSFRPAMDAPRAG